MADVEEPQFTTLAERIAALNRQKNFSSPDPAPKPRAPPPPLPASRPPPRQPSSTQSQSTTPAPTTSQTKPARPPPLPRRTTGGDAVPSVGPNHTAPPLPSRTAPARSHQPSPALTGRASVLPPPPPSDGRRVSTSSERSYLSSVSATSLGHPSSNSSSTSNDSRPSRKLPPPLEKAILPPLPPSRRDTEAKSGGATSKPQLPARHVEPPPSRPTLPPRLPSRPAKPPPPDRLDEQKPPTPRRLPPGPVNYVKSPYAEGQPLANTKTPRTPLRLENRDVDDTPPPIPLASRPSATEVEAVSTRSTAVQDAPCLICRDFSEPDRVASLYPRESLPMQDPIGFLARALCDPFTSLTDKARAIFTWHHHNVAYDYQAFFSGGMKYSSAEDVAIHGKAVCAGYANCFEGIAKRAGLECIVVTGHGKGFGHKALGPGESPPPRSATGHAWNAVRIDNGEWKLVDACWGAGHLNSESTYTKEFNPIQFTYSNEKFGLEHYPADDRYFFREDRRRPSWEEYFIGEFPDGAPMTYSDLAKEGIDRESLSPHALKISKHGQDVIRFQMHKICEHWDSEKNGRGKQALFLLTINGSDGKTQEYLPLDTDGYWCWIDIRAKDLGNSGQSIGLWWVVQYDGRDGRGVTKQQFSRNKLGPLQGIARWEIA